MEDGQDRSTEPGDAPGLPDPSGQEGGYVPVGDTGAAGGVVPAAPQADASLGEPPQEDPDRAPARAPDWLDAYQPLAGVSDELLRSDGGIRDVWEPLIRHLARQTPEESATAFARGSQYLRDAGVYFRQYTESSSALRDWPFSPIPVLIAEEEWQQLAEGLKQRADLLEALMADLYGPATVIARGLLPPQLIAENPEWLRPMVGVHPRSGHYLHVLAFEIGRSPDGSWLVLGDRTQAPSGPGFALENRMAATRVYPDLFPKANVQRLAGVFRAFRDRLHALHGASDGRAAILTPGQHTDTYFEHAYIARYLGLLLLEGADLAVTPEGVMVRTIAGLEPVTTLWRRMDSRFADPLELLESSAIGTPGMISALRAGQVDMLNALGSGVLETRALMAFLPRIAEQLTGAPLMLPNIATWWCGQSAERAHVGDTLDKMMIAPALSTRLPFEIDGSTELGGRFRTGARGAVRDWLAANGAELVGQEAVTLSTTPAMIDGQLQPRPMMIRAFAVRTANGWEIMPGGYARIGRTEDPTALAMQRGGSVADVWVVSQTAVTPDTLTPETSAPFLRKTPTRLPARAADNLFWLGRYVERAEMAVRCLRAYHLRSAASAQVSSPLLALLDRGLARQGLSEGLRDLGNPQTGAGPHPGDAAGQQVPPALVGYFEAALGCAGKVRDRFSDDGWFALNDLTAGLRASNMASQDAGKLDPGALADVMSGLLRKLAGFAGLVNDNMFRSAGWRFMMLGQGIERGIQLAHLLADTTDPEAPQGSLDAAIEIGDSTMSHRRRYSVATRRESVIDLLALDPDNPRSIAFQVARLETAQARLPQPYASSQKSEVARALLRLSTDLATARPEEVSPDDLNDIAVRLMQVSDALAARYMS